MRRVQHRVEALRECAVVPGQGGRVQRYYWEAPAILGHQRGRGQDQQLHHHPKRLDQRVNCKLQKRGVQDLGVQEGPYDDWGAKPRRLGQGRRSSAEKPQSPGGSHVSPIIVHRRCCQYKCASSIEKAHC